MLSIDKTNLPSIQCHTKLGIDKSNHHENVTRTALKIFTGILAATAGYSFIALSTKNIEFIPLRILVATAFFFTCFSSITWSYHNVIDDSEKRIKHVDYEIALAKKGKLIPNKKKEIIKEVLIKIPVCSIALLSIFDEIYISYFYNQQNLIFPILTGFAIIGIPIYATDLVFKACLNRYHRSAFEKELDEIKQHIRNKLADNKAHISLLSNREKNTYYHKIQSCNSIRTELITSIANMSVILKNKEKIRDDQPIEHIKKLAYANTIAMSVALAVNNFVIAYRAAKFLNSQPDSSHFYCEAIGAINLFINLYANAVILHERSIDFFGNVFSHPLKLISGHSITYELSPKLRIIAGAISAMMIGLANVGYSSALKDNYEGMTLMAMQILLPASFALIDLNSMEYIVDKCINYFIDKHGSKPQRNMLQLEHFFDKMSDFIELSSFSTFAKILHELPDHVLHELAHQEVEKSIMHNIWHLLKDKSHQKIDKKIILNYLRQNSSS